MLLFATICFCKIFSFLLHSYANNSYPHFIHVRGNFFHLVLTINALILSVVISLNSRCSAWWGVQESFVKRSFTTGYANCYTIPRLAKRGCLMPLVRQWVIPRQENPNRPFSLWRHLTATTRIHFVFALLFKFVNFAGFYNNSLNKTTNWRILVKGLRLENETRNLIYQLIHWCRMLRKLLKSVQ